MHKYHHDPGAVPEPPVTHTARQPRQGSTLSSLPRSFLERHPPAAWAQHTEGNSAEFPRVNRRPKPSARPPQPEGRRSLHVSGPRTHKGPARSTKPDQVAAHDMNALPLVEHREHLAPWCNGEQVGNALGIPMRWHTPS